MDPREAAVAPAIAARLVGELAPADRAVFARVERAMHRVESGGEFVPSRLRTTAGAPASLGRGQLLVRLQVAELRRLPAQARAGLGVRDADLDLLDARGQAGLAWFDAVVSGRVSHRVAPAIAADVRALARRHDWETIVARHGPAFAEATGLPPEELANLARTRALVAASSRVRAGASLARARASLDLGPLAERLGSDLDTYLRRGLTGELRNGWYTRAAQSAPDAWARFHDALANGGDLVTTRARQLRDFRTARATIARLEGADGLVSARRARLVAELARVAHGGIGDLRSLLASAEGRPIRTVDELEHALDRAVAAPGSSLGRSLRRFRAAFESTSPRVVRA